MERAATVAVAAIMLVVLLGIQRQVAAQTAGTLEQEALQPMCSCC